jgi:hypothetical protein
MNRIKTKQLPRTKMAENRQNTVHTQQNVGLSAHTGIRAGELPAWLTEDTAICTGELPAWLTANKSLPQS